MTRADIIAQLDAELFRLERARDYLAAALKGSRTRFFSKIEFPIPQLASQPLPQKVRKQRSASTRAVPPGASIPAAPVPVLVAVPEHEVKRVPPRRRVERRHAQGDKMTRTPAALSGFVPAGPVAVSANEARKHERAMPTAVMPAVAEMRSQIGAERSLGSLIQAFERQTGFDGAETT